MGRRPGEHTWHRVPRWALNDIDAATDGMISVCSCCELERRVRQAYSQNAGHLTYWRRPFGRWVQRIRRLHPCKVT